MCSTIGSSPPGVAVHVTDGHMILYWRLISVALIPWSKIILQRQILSDASIYGFLGLYYSIFPYIGYHVTFSEEIDVESVYIVFELRFISVSIKYR